MVDIIYNFIRVDLMGNTSISGADNLALLLTWAVIIATFLLFVKLVFWAFNIAFSFIRGRKRRF